MKENHVELKKRNTATLIKKCHRCGHLMEGPTEPEKCGQCQKSFLPSRYFEKVHAKNSEEFKQLFASSHELNEEDLIKGLHVLW